MPDRVATIGAKVTPSTIRGQGCLCPTWIYEKVTGADEAAAGVGANTDYPVGLTDIDHLMELYWRWKTPRANWTMPEGTWATGSATHSLSGEMTTAGATTTREAELVIPSALLVIKDLDVYSTVEGQRDFGGTVSIFEELATEPVIKFYNGKYYPRMYVTLWELYDDDEGFYYIDNYMGTYEDEPEFGTPATAFTGTLSLSSGDYDIPMYVLNNPSTVEAFTLDCTEYWPHKTAVGAAKFNTLTGAKL